MIAYSTPAAVLAVSITLTVLCAILVVLRFLPKGHKVKPMIDDWLCLVALVMTIGMTVGIVVGVARKSLAYPTPPKGRGKAPQSIEVEKIEWAVQMIQCLQLGFTKLSFVVLFRRIFVTHRKSAFSIATWVMIALLIGWTIAFFFAFLFACNGHFSQWWFKPQTCIGLDFENAFALSECLMDFLIILMPVPMIWTLHMTVHRKIAVTCIFALGALAVIISVVRLVIFYQAKHSTVKKNTDHDLLITLILFWSLIESTVALIAACLPTVYGLFGRRIIESVVRSAHSLRSLGSHHSSTHRQGHDSTFPQSHMMTDPDKREPRGSDASRAPILPYGEPLTNNTSTFAMKDTDGAHTAGNVRQGQIHVAKAITQTDNSV